MPGCSVCRVAMTSVEENIRSSSFVRTQVRSPQKLWVRFTPTFQLTLSRYVANCSLSVFTQSGSASPSLCSDEGYISSGGGKRKTQEVEASK